jgi:hypothetical protein
MGTEDAFEQMREKYEKSADRVEDVGMAQVGAEAEKTERGAISALRARGELTDKLEKFLTEGAERSGEIVMGWEKEKRAFYGHERISDDLGVGIKWYDRYDKGGYYRMYFAIKDLDYELNVGEEREVAELAFGYARYIAKKVSDSSKIVGLVEKFLSDLEIIK